jgi:ATP-dependent RNA helicase DeaD
MTNPFLQLNLHPQLVQAVTDRGYETPTPIQSAVIPLMLDGQDVIGQAQTGTGKTAAFALPLLQTLTPDHRHVQGLVLAPTRELALQVADAITAYGRHQDVRVLAVYGGQPYGIQIRQLKRGVDIVVGTPGRLLDLIRQNVLKLNAVQSVVLDEADEMLSMGFIEDIETILAEIPTSRQTALFSATVPPAIRRLAERFMDNPETVSIERKQRTVAAIEQRYYLVNESDKLAALTRLFEVEDITSALIFARTRIGTGTLANELSVRGFPAEALNGDLSQDARERVLNRFQTGKIKVLVATDIAARGLDIDDISHVFNFDLPQFPEVFVHRVGRTGRAGRTGIAITLVTPKEQWRLRKIESYTRQQITRATLPSVEDIETRRREQLLGRITVWLNRGRCGKEREMVAQLAQAGYDPMEIAAAALKLAQSEDKQRPIAPVREVRMTRSSNRRDDRRNNSSRGTRRNGQPSGRSFRDKGRDKGRDKDRDKDMVRLTMNAGKTHGVRPNDVVGTIAYHADIPGRTIGAIRIRDEHTLVDVPEQYVDQVLAKADRYQIHRRSVNIERA